MWISNAKASLKRKFDRLLYVRRETGGHRQEEVGDRLFLYAVTSSGGSSPLSWSKFCSRGLNFAVTPKKILVLHVIAGVEGGIRSIKVPQEVAERTRIYISNWFSADDANTA